MIKGLLRSGWGQQVAVGAAYLALGTAIHYFSGAVRENWNLAVGLQITCLLLIPYRFWIAVLVAAHLPAAYDAVDCLPKFGFAWSAMRLVPNILISMGVVWFARKHMRVFPSREKIDMRVVFWCAVTASAGVALYSVTLLSLVRNLPNNYDPGARMWFVYFLGNLTGVLTLLPVGLLAHTESNTGGLQAAVNRAVRSATFIDAIAVFLPLTIALALAATRADVETGVLIEVAMLLPAAWLAYKHGWRAVTIASTVIILCDAALHPRGIDANSVEVSAALDLGLIAIYALGARVSVKKGKEQLEIEHAASQYQMVRQNLILSERKVKAIAQKMEFVAGNLSVFNSRMLEQLRRYVPNLESHAFYKQAARAHEQVYQLAESLHPVAWRERGLPAALTETIARALDEAGMSYRCEISGRGFISMDPLVLTGIYRMACEIVCHIANDLTCSGIKLSVRGGQSKGDRWAVLRVEGVLDENVVAKAVFYTENRRELGLKLGANFFETDDMRAHLQAFRGLLHVRSKSGRYVMTCLLHDHATTETKEAVSSPLWVV